MKKLIALALITVGIGLSARAQEVVYDPVMNIEQIIDEAENIAKYITMIENQVEQIEKLTDQLNEFKHYEQLFGDPGSVLLSTVQPLLDDLKKSEAGQTLNSLESTINTSDAMLYNADGLFQSVGTTFTTPDGQTLTRQTDPFKPIAAVQKTTDNYLSVSTDAAARRVELKNQIAATTEQLKSASTDAEVQKLQGELTGLSAALNNTDYEINQATASALVQDIANRNDKQRQVEAQQQQQHAEFTEAIQKYGQTFKLLNAPTEFPTP
jgi:predicted  nucleic acid-binding Zn-ribbon protein